jgi:CubicO group peptidase (beta-lactamase class C family)
MRSNILWRRINLLLLIVLIGVAGSLHTVYASGGKEPGAVEKYVYPGEDWEPILKAESVGYSSEKFKPLRDYIKTIKTTGLMVIVGGKVLFEYGDVKQLSYLASVRKSILAMLYGKYVANGKIDLDKSLKDLGMSDHGGLLPVEEKATIRHLISARSGIYHKASNPGDNTADAPDRGSQSPGKYFLYNNWDFNAAGAAFEKQTGKDIYDALESDFAKPIGMQDFDRSRQEKSGDMERSKYQAYHMWLSTRDMARIGYLMLRKGNWNGKQLIPKEWTKKIVSIITPITEMNPIRLREWKFGYGYMWWVWEKYGSHGLFEGAHTGMGAFGQYITVIPKLDMVIAHKTAVPPRKFVSWVQYEGIIDKIIEARIKK